MRRAFTLLEMLIVVATISILIAMVFRVGNVASENSKHNVTVNRLQRLENAISGYYAAYGTYPPVKYHNLPDIYMPVSDSGVQKADEGRNSAISWAQIKAACEAQPVGCFFPFSSGKAEMIEKYSQHMKKWASKHAEDLDGLGMQSQREKVMAGYDTGCSPTPARFNPYRDLEDWRELQLFKFGLMSYLLPRYLFMMSGHKDFLSYMQWTNNNEIPCNPLTGKKDWAGEGADDEDQWAEMKKDAEDYKEDQAEQAASGTYSSSANSLPSVSSQAACARWMANFEQSLSCSGSSWMFYGINVTDPDDGFHINWSKPNIKIPIYTPGNEEGTSDQYILDSITIRDGWDNEFFYYSPPPFQSYIVWSAGANGKTFPPWIDRRNLNISDADNERINEWIDDDIVGLRK